MNQLKTYRTKSDDRKFAYQTMVLLIDDQTTVAKAVQHLLIEAPDIDFHYISDPMEALTTAIAIKPTVILQDLVMPAIEGIDLLKLFRTNPATAETPIIMLSSEDNPLIKSQAFAAGANDYLVKLPDKTELIARIRYHSKAHLNKILREEAFKSLQESQQQLSETNMTLISVNRRLEEAHDKLNTALLDTERRAREAGKLTELVDVLQSCQTTAEAYEIVRSTLPRLLPFKSGALCITSASRNIVEAVSVWGGTLGTDKTFTPVSCWALRRGKTHLVKDPASPMTCGHAGGCSARGYVCVPLAAQGETLGVLYLECPSEGAKLSAEQLEDQLEAMSRHATAAGERISLALANLSLREVLRVQSIRDPLTGLYNRRYMEESLGREIHRASRTGQPVSMLVLDIDHFKQFNDTFGHQAGDTLLRALGEFISKRTRGQDIACRMGGEEFALILTGASADAAYKRSELLLEEVSQLIVRHNEEVLGKIYLSIGVSTFPEHASTAEELLHAADKALYRAKSEGRNRVLVAGCD